MHDIVKLIGDHDVMDRLADRLIAGARPGQAAPSDCRALMTELAERMAAHVADESEFLRPDEACTGQSAFDREVVRFDAQFSALTEHWQAYMEHWTEARIVAERSAYAGNTADMMTAFKMRIARGNEVLYPLALDAGRIAAAG